MQKSFTDQLGNHITINYPPKRIISLVPSQTELLFDLGLNEEVVGITKFCIHPVDKFAAKTKVGGTKKLNIELIRALKPDLIIGNKEENNKEDIELLQQEFEVWISDVNTLEDAQETITSIANLVDRQPEAAYLNHLIGAGFRDLQTLAVERNIKARVAYVIWKNPYMLAGRQTFIHDILTKVGLINVVTAERYPETSVAELQALKPNCILLSSEPFPFKADDLLTLKEQINEANVMLVDGEMFSWYGSRLVKAVQYFFELQNNFTENE